MEGVPINIKKVKRNSDKGQIHSIDHYIFVPISYRMKYIKFYVESTL